MIVALNMMDVAERHGMHIDPYKLGVSIGAPVVPLVASRNEGIGTLKDVIESVAGNAAAPDSGAERKRGIALTHVLETTLATVSRELADQGVARHRRFVAAALLEGDEAVAARVGRVGHLASVAASGETLSVARYHAIDALLEHALHRTAVRRTVTDMLDAVFLNRVLAFPLFLGVMYLMFMFTINIGSAFIDFFDLSGMALFVEGPRQIYAWLGLPVWLSTFLADGIGGGVRLVSTFIPVIACLFLFLSFLEDSGYMGRAAFIVDRLMRRVGLPGKSFVPLIVGFGCNVPAVMATRTLDSEHDRVLTTLMAPYMSCGARLTVYALFAVAFFPTNGQNLVFALYLLGIGVAVMSALIVRRYLLPRASSTFVMELPAYHMPTLRGLFMHTWQRLKGFVLRAGKAIVTVVVVLNLVSTIGTDGSVGNENTNKSVLSAIGRTLTPGFGPMGIANDNWPATVGIFTGVFAKEVVVGTLNALYENLDGVTQAERALRLLGHDAGCGGERADESRRARESCRRSARARPRRPRRHRGASAATERRPVDDSADAAAVRHEPRGIRLSRVRPAVHAVRCDDRRDLQGTRRILGDVQHHVVGGHGLLLRGDRVPDRFVRRRTRQRRSGRSLLAMRRTCRIVRRADQVGSEVASIAVG